MSLVPTPLYRETESCNLTDVTENSISVENNANTYSMIPSSSETSTEVLQLNSKRGVYSLFFKEIKL
jgi:hypothetical protein